MSKDSWGTMKIVAPRADLACRKGRITVWEDLESKLLVGSPVRISRGDERPGHSSALFFATGDLSRVLIADGRDAEHIAQLICPCFRHGRDSTADDG